MDKVTISGGLGLVKFLFMLTLSTNTIVSCQTQHSELSITKNETKTIPIDLVPAIGNNCQLALYIKVNYKTPATEITAARNSGKILFTITDPNKNNQVTFTLNIGQKKKLQEVCFDSCENIKALDLKVTSSVTEETFISIEALKGSGTCEVHRQSSAQEIIIFIILVISAIFVGIIFKMINTKALISRVTTWLKSFLKQNSKYEKTTFQNAQKDTRTGVFNEQKPLLFGDEIKRCSILRGLSVGVSAALLLDGLQMVVVGFSKNTRDPITQDTSYCPAEPLLPSYQIKVGSWLCLATVMRVAATMLCYFIFTEIYYPNNQNFTCGKGYYFTGHSLLLLFDCFNFSVFVYFSSIYIKMFNDTLRLEDVEMSGDEDNLYCDRGLYFSALIGFIIMCVLAWFAIVMIVIHIATIIKIFRRFKQEKGVEFANELERMNVETT